MASFRRCEIWSSYQCDGGAREAVLARADCAALSSTERITREDTLSLTVPKASSAAASLALGRVLRLVYDDESIDEWRIHELVDQSGRDGGRYRIVCRSVLYELRDLALIASTSSGILTTAATYDGRTATNVVDSLLTFLPGWWARGTVTPTTPVSISLTTDATPLRVLRTLVETLRAAGDACELDVRRNGTSGYYIDIVTAIGAAASTADVRSAKNILTSDRTRSREPLMTRVYPRGSGGTSIEYAYWRVAAVAGNDVELRQPESGAAAIGFDDQLNGLYLENDAGTRVLISDSVASTSVATVSSSAGFSVGELCRVCADGSGAGLASLSYPLASAAKVGIIEGGEDGTTNILTNPYLSTWPGSTSAPPTGWSSGGPGGATYTRNTTVTFIRRGAYSLRCQTTATTQFVRSDTANVLPGRGTTYSAQVDIYRVTSGGVTVLLRNQAGASLSSTTLPAGTAQWHTVQFTGINVGAATGLYLEVQNSAGGAVEFYIDSAQITVGAAQSPWTLGSSPAVLWRRGLVYLVDNAVEPTTYTLTVADLNRWSPHEWPYDAFVLGATLRLTDTELGIATSSRITEITRDYLNPLQTSLVLERATRTLTTTLAAA